MRANYQFLFGLFFLLIIATGCNKTNLKPPLSLKVMTFNIWVGGGKSVGATAEVFVKSEADIIGIQESKRDNVNMAIHIADSLGWYAHEINNDVTIVSKYPIVDTATSKKGVKIQIDDTHFVWMFNVHTMYCPYEPYQLNGIEYCGGPLLNSAEEAIASAKATRGEEVSATIKEILETQKEGFPIFLVGDFNEPSSLDWTAKAAAAGLCKMEVSWPTTESFMTQADMKDSYRTLYPDEVKQPGHTWTSLPPEKDAKEVYDRIDFVFFWGDKVTLNNSQIIGEVGKMSDIGFANYPSDHRAVISTFSLH